jgi:hypothetical protein
MEMIGMDTKQPIIPLWSFFPSHGDFRIALETMLWSVVNVSDHIFNHGGKIAQDTIQRIKTDGRGKGCGN